MSRSPRVETLEDRRLLAVVSYDSGTSALTFNADVGEMDDLTVVGNSGANTLQLTVGNGDAITLAGDAIANPDFVLSTAISANDTLTINAGGSFLDTFTINAGDLNDTVDASLEGGVVFTSLTINGEDGADNLTGSAFGDALNGGDGVDTIIGGDGPDTIIGGLGADLQFGDAGDDLFIWNNGDGPDDNIGGADTDTFTFNGADGADDMLNLLAGPGDGSLGGAAFNLERTAPSAFTIEGVEIENITVNGLAGNDTFNGSTLPAGIFTNVTINGGIGNDNLTGTQGVDTINGGDDDDTIIGGLGADLQFGDAGDDEFIWNNGDGPDDNIGGADDDTFTFNGADGADDVLDLLAGPGDGSLIGAAFNLERTAPSAFTIEGVEIENIAVNGLAGNDTVDGSTLPVGIFNAVTINGGIGNDNLTGTQGVDTINGGDDNDTITGGLGADLQFGDAGDDEFIWDNGDGPDDNIGGADTDTFTFNGADGADDVLNLLAGPGDGSLVGAAFNLERTAPSAFTIEGVEIEDINVNGLAGDDVFSGSTLPAGIFTNVTINGGIGNDNLTGTQGIDTINGGDDDDTIIGGLGADIQFGDAGDDEFIWDNGDGPDDNIGGADDDTFVFNGADGAGDVLTLAAGVGDGSLAGADFHLERTAPSAFFIENVGIENAEVNGLDGNDDITIEPSLDLEITVDGADPETSPGDSLIVDLAGTTGASLSLTGPREGLITFTSGQEPIDFTDIEALTPINGLLAIGPINTGAAADSIIVSRDGLNTVVTVNGIEQFRLPTAAIAGALTINGEGDNDTLTIDMAGGDPIPDGGINFNGGGQSGTPGDTIVLQNGAVNTTTYTFVNENDGSINIDGSTINYTGLEPVIDNLGAVNRIFTFTGGAETITLSDDGTAGDSISLIDSTLGESVLFTNPTASLTINAGSGIDTVNVASIDTGAVIPNLTVNGDAEGDTLNLVAIAAGDFGAITINGGTGNDIITGSGGADTINGGADDDTIIGGLGADIQFGDAGDDLFIWNNGDGPDDNTGGADIDTFTFNGADGPDDVLNLLPGPGDGSLVGAAFNLQRTAPSAFTIEGVTIENINVNTLGGNDTFDGSTLPAGIFTNVTINGGTGNDILIGTQGIDTINGGDNNDTIVGGLGNDLLLGDAGEDQFTWNNGDGADDVVGGADTDSFVFNGADGPGDSLQISPGVGDGSLPGTEFNLTRFAPTFFSLEFTTLEVATVNGLNGTDSISVSDLSGQPNLDTLNLNGNDGNDTFDVQLNTTVDINVDGGDPVAPALPGDTLFVDAPQELNIFSDKAGNVSLSSTIGVTPTLPLTLVSIETTNLTPGNGVVNLVGDNNDFANFPNQTDQFIVRGQDVDSGFFEGDADGANEFSVEVNGNNALLVRNTTFLNVLGNAIGEMTSDAVDTLDISPYADDSPAGWGIDVFFNEGLPNGADGGAADLLIYNTAAFGGMVSEDIVVRPSGPDNGELIVTNGSFGTPIVDIDYVANTDIIINDNDGFANDTDTLTLLGSDPSNPGTSGNETIVADFTMAGGVGTPQFSVLDGAAILYNVRSFTGFNTVDVQTLGGNDSLVVTPDTTNANGLQNVALRYDGGDLVGDSLTVNALNGLRVTPGSESTSGIVDQLGAGVGNVTYINTGLINATSATAGSALTVRGTNGEDTIAIQPTAVANEALIWVNDGTVIRGNTGGVNNNLATVNLQGRFGDDAFSVTAIADVAINVDGGDPTASDTVTINATVDSNTIVVSALGTASATVDITGLGQVNLSTVESLLIDGQGGDDDLTYTSPGTGAEISFIPGANVDSGSITADTFVGNALIPVAFENLDDNGTLTFANTGGGRTDGLDVIGTGNDDLFTLTDTGQLQVFKPAFQPAITLPIETPGVTFLRLIGQDGDDTFNVAGDHPIDTGVEIQGGNPDSGSDVLNFNGSGVGEVTLDLDENTITEDGFESVRYTGLETINIDAGGAAFTVTGTDDEDIFTLGQFGVAGSGQLQHNLSPGLVFNYSNSTTATVNGGGDNDSLNILGDDFADVVTSTATTVTVDGSTVTFDATIEGLNLFTLGGDDNVTLTGLTIDAMVDAGAGNDIVDASGVADDNVQLVLLGGAGNDNLIGGDSPTGSALGDVLDGGDGNDRLEGGRGQDFFFGGAGSDQLVWVAGDGSDLMEGGDGEDEMLFIALGGNNRLELFGGGRFGAIANPAPNVFGAGTLENAARSIFALNSGAQDTAAVFLNMGDIENINVDAGAGADQVIINNQVDTLSTAGSAIQLGTDLASTSVTGIEVNLGAADAAADNVEFHGHQVGDDVNISVIGGDIDVAGFGYSLRISDSEVANDRLSGHGQGGDDVIKAEAGVELAIGITLNGGEGDDYLSADAIINGGAGNDTLIGGAGADTINGDAGDDVIDGRGGNNVIDGGAGTDTILVSGTAAGETLGVVHTAGTLTITGGLSAGVNAITMMEAVRVEAGDGSDTIDITTLAAGGLDYEVLGGNPIGAVGDTLNVTSANAITFMGGPESDSGAFTDNVTGNIVSFDEIESIGVVLLPPGAIIVMGTGADDDITAIGLAANTVSVQVNDGPAIVYAGVNNVTLQGKAGDDDITVDVNNATGVTFNVDGGLPTAGSDDLRITGTDGTDDAPVWTPGAADAGVMTFTGLMPINVTFIENLYYDGESDNETLTSVSAAGQVTHTAGEGPDAGRLRDGSLLPLNYEQLGATGTVTASGAASLSVLGTELTDVIAVTAATGTVTHTADGEVRVAILQTNVNLLTVNALAGDDTVTVAGDHPYAGGVNVNGGQPDSGSDVLNFIGGGAAVTVDLAAGTVQEFGFGAVAYAGKETVNIDANAALTVNGTTSNDILNVTPTGAGMDGHFNHDGTVGVVFNYIDAATATFAGGGGTADELNIFGDGVADSIGSAASAVTVDLSTVTLGGGIEVLSVYGLAGDDVIDLSNLVFAGSVNIHGGDDQDTLTGTASVDTIYGGSGNDTIDALAGNDFIYGGDGNDTITGGTGNDSQFGGAGSDTFIWNNGDNDDITEGDEGLDVQVVNGAGVGDAFTLSADQTGRAIFQRTNLIPFTISTGDLEQFNVNGLAGEDTFAVADLTQTDVQVVNLDLGAAADADAVTVEGRTTADALRVTNNAGVLTVAGLGYDINVLQSSLADNDTLTINGNEGDDSIDIANTVQAISVTTINGGVGDDSLFGWFNTANGGAGDDFIRGAANGQTINGGAGEDTLIGGGGLDTIDGGDDYDQILISGTSAADAISVTQSAAGTLDFSVNGAADTDTIVTVAGIPTVESVRVEAGDGADTIVATWADALGVDAVANSLRIEIDGGDDFAADRLGVLDDGTGDLVIQHVGAVSTEGGIEIGPDNAESLILTYENVEIVQPIAAADGRVEVFKHDPFEFNDAITIATHLGAAQTINVDPTINPGIDPIFGLPADTDYFRLEAEVTGTLDIQAFFEQIANVPSGRPGLPGDGDLTIQLFDEDGDLIAGTGDFGTSDADDNGRIRVPVVQGQVYFLQVLGESDNAINAYDLTIINALPPTPFDIELDDALINGVAPEGSDTGRNQFDNVTLDNTPTFFFRLDDSILLNDVANPVDDDAIAIPFQAGPVDAGFAVAVFDEGQTPGTDAGTVDPQTPLGYATQVPGEPGLYTFTSPLLSDGSHFISARVEMIDPSNPQAVSFGPRSESLEIIVDTVAPPVAFGNPVVAGDGLHPDSDSGDAGLPATQVDRITNDLTPTFFGRAEADSIIRAYVDADGNGVFNPAIDVLIGQTVTVPLDGSNQEPNGEWEITSTVNMNDPNLLGGLGIDGLRTIFLTSEDLAGNVSTPDISSTLEVFVDTQGPQVTDVRITGSPTYDLFTIKPGNVVQGPTPRVDSLTISVQDLPNRVASFLYAALSNVVNASSPISVIGDHSGIQPIATIVFNSDPLVAGNAATGDVVLTFTEPLPDDRFTLSIDDSLIDPAGNNLDGESDSDRPLGGLNLPSGDLIPGGDFVARFTVDSRPEVGSISQGLVYVDINGNQVFDPEGQDNDEVNRDFVYQFGRISDGLFAGNFGPAGGDASGFDKLGAYGALNSSSSNPQYTFLLDTHDDGVGDLSSPMPAAYQVAGIPVAGNFSGAKDGDEIGLFSGTDWYLDTNGNNAIDLGEIIPTDYIGVPMVGDFNGDGSDDLAVYVNDTNTIIFDTNRDGFQDFTLSLADDFNRFPGLSGFTDKPVVGDINLDGVDDFGIWVKGRGGVLPHDAGEYFFWVSDNPLGAADVNPANNFNNFSPDTLPGGNDLFTQWGDEFALPIFGNFDPIVGEGAPEDIGSVTNASNAADVNNDGSVTALDALIVINALNDGNTGIDLSNARRAEAVLGEGYYDVDGNSVLTAVDALRVINVLNDPTSAQSTPSSEPLAEASWHESVDSFFEDEDDDEDETLDEVIALMF